MIKGQTFYYDLVTDRIELRSAKPSTVPSSQTHQVNSQAKGVQNSQSINFGPSTSINGACLDQTPKWLPEENQRKDQKR